MAAKKKTAKKKTTSKKSVAKKSNVKEKKNSVKLDEDSKLFAFLATFLSIVGFVIAVLVKKEDRYVMFYAKQSLLVFLVFVASGVIMIIPLLGWIIGVLLYIVGLVLWIISWINALSGEMKEVPIIGEYHTKFDF